jgi:hypothetical protein
MKNWTILSMPPNFMMLTSKVPTKKSFNLQHPDHPLSKSWTSWSKHSLLLSPFGKNVSCRCYKTFLYPREKVGREQNSEETKRERERQVECCYKRVTAWAINLTIGNIFVTPRARLI